MRIKILDLSLADDGKHKYVVTLLRLGGNPRLKTVKFGADGMMDYTLYYKRDGKEVADIHRDAYIARHSGEDWTNPLTAGFWSRWLLWEKPTVKESLHSILDKNPSWKV